MNMRNPSEPTRAATHLGSSRCGKCAGPVSHTHAPSDNKRPMVTRRQPKHRHPARHSSRLLSRLHSSATTCELQRRPFLLQTDFTTFFSQSTRDVIVFPSCPHSALLLFIPHRILFLYCTCSFICGCLQLQKGKKCFFLSFSTEVIGVIRHLRIFVFSWWGNTPTHTLPSHPTPSPHTTAWRATRHLRAEQLLQPRRHDTIQLCTLFLSCVRVCAFVVQKKKKTCKSHRPSQVMQVT